MAVLSPGALQRATVVLLSRLRHELGMPGLWLAALVRREGAAACRQCVMGTIAGVPMRQMRLAGR